LSIVLLNRYLLLQLCESKANEAINKTDELILSVILKKAYE